MGLNVVSGGEGGIRTHGTETAHLISSQAHSTTLAPLRSKYSIVVGWLPIQPSIPGDTYTLNCNYNH